MRSNRPTHDVVLVNVHATQGSMGSAFNSSIMHDHSPSITRNGIRYWMFDTANTKIEPSFGHFYAGKVKGIDDPKDRMRPAEARFQFQLHHIRERHEALKAEGGVGIEAVVMAAGMHFTAEESLRFAREVKKIDPNIKVMVNTLDTEIAGKGFVVNEAGGVLNEAVIEGESVMGHGVVIEHDGKHYGLARDVDALIVLGSRKLQGDVLNALVGNESTRTTSLSGRC